MIITQQSQKLFDQARDELRRAQETLDAGRYGEAERLAYQASDSIAAGYMAHVSGEAISSDASDEIFQTFVSHIRSARTTSEETQNIDYVVGIVAGLREVHDWSPLNEITKADAETTILRVTEMLGVVEKAV